AGHPSSVTLRSRAGRGFDSAWHNLRLWVAITRGYVPAQDCWGTPGGDLCMVKRDRHPGRVGMLRNAARKCAALFAGCLLTLSLAVSAQTRQLLNYEAIHKPAAGTAGMVVSQNEAASRVGAQVLRDGGNAVDAAVATAFVLAVTLPRAGNIGGDGFMLIHLAGTDQYTAIDYRSAAPALATLDAYVGEDGELQGHSAGIRSAGVPGTVAGLALAHEKYGRLPWKRLLEPAIAMARDGIVLSADEAFALEWGTERLARSEAGAAVFLDADGEALRAGERLVQADL